MKTKDWSLDQIKTMQLMDKQAHRADVISYVLCSIIFATFIFMGLMA